MRASEKSWKEYVESYDIAVPEEVVEREVQYFILQARHNMQYDRLTGGEPHIFPAQELEAQRESLRAAAYFEAKADMVMCDILKKHTFPVSSAELETKAMDMARRENTTLDMIRVFFGEDLSGLMRDVRERKAMEWACRQLEASAPPTVADAIEEEARNI